MKSVLFFKNARIDGGVHIGLEYDGELLFEDLREGPHEPDPILDWFVDIECGSARIPKHPDDIREWFLRQAPAINKALEDVARQAEIGTDGGLYPITRRFKPKSRPKDVVDVEIRVQAVRRIRAVEIAKRILETRNSWEKDLAKLPSGQLRVG